MSILDKIKELKSKGVYISLDGNELIINSDQAIYEGDLTWLRENKQNLINYFKSLISVYKKIPVYTDEFFDFPLSSAQKRLWVLSKFENTANIYSIYETYYIKGILNEQAFSKAYESLLTRHEVLRTVFTEDTEGNPRQRVLPITDGRFNIQILDLSNESIGLRETRINEYVSEEVSRGFSLEEGPLIRCSLLKETENRYIWVLLMHH